MRIAKCSMSRGHAVITSEQLRMGRAALRLSKQELADAAGVSLATIQRWEAGSGRGRWVNETEERIEAALKERGIVFIENGVLFHPPSEE
jgi:transcriptional regulator with XRE-family HTH domain